MPIAAGIAAFEDQKYFEDTCQRVIASRSWLTNSLDNLGFKVMPSAGNFIFVRHNRRAAEELALSLRQNGIIVRHFKQSRIQQFLRITIGTEKQNERLVNTLTTLLGG